MNFFKALFCDAFNLPAFKQGINDFYGKNCIETSIYYKGQYIYFEVDPIETVTNELKRQRKAKAWTEYRRVREAEKK